MIPIMLHLRAHGRCGLEFFDHIGRLFRANDWRKVVGPDWFGQCSQLVHLFWTDLNHFHIWHCESPLF